jgi:hypothetical protein
MKKLELYLNTCSECPYCQHNSSYDISYDSGYDCVHDSGSGRIIDDYYWNKLDYQTIERGIPIPVNCPLEDITRKDKLKKLITKIKENENR